MNIPKFTTPLNLQGEICLGEIVPVENVTEKGISFENCKEYRIDEKELGHTLITGCCRSGKTVTAMKLINELAKIKRKNSNKRLRIIILDSSRQWRELAKFIEPERLNLYSLTSPGVNIKINPWKIPKGVSPKLWINSVIDVFCGANELSEQDRHIIETSVYKLYQEAGVFDAYEKDNWEEIVPELSKAVNFATIYKHIKETKIACAICEIKYAYARFLSKFSCFSDENSIEYNICGTSEGKGIDELIGADDVTIFEYIDYKTFDFKNFLFGVFTLGVYNHAVNHKNGYLADDEFETVLVVEEANNVFCNISDLDVPYDKSTENELDYFVTLAEKNGLYIFSITQKIADMPSSIIANSKNMFIGKLKRTEDVTTVMKAISSKNELKDSDIVEWLPKNPVGWFICQFSKSVDYNIVHPALVRIAKLEMECKRTIENKSVDK